MEVVRTRRELQARADGWRRDGRRIGLVPTMGALHAGHLALVDAARCRCDVVGVSIFVNPTQFNAASDLDAYPRTVAQDLDACRARGVDFVFLPSEAELYPPGADTWVEVPGLSEPMEGAARPGHFRGVTTVVAKLLLAAKPHVACFGEKDYQQLALIRRMAQDLGFDCEIVAVPTLREPDGLALSSRNVRLTPASRSEARCIARGLDAAETAVRSGARARDAILHQVKLELEKSGLAEIDYVALCDPESLAPAPERLESPALLALAVFFPGHDGDVVRLIDNRVLPDPQS